MSVRESDGNVRGLGSSSHTPCPTLSPSHLLSPGGQLRHGDVELALERNHDIAGVLREARDGVKRRDDQALGGGEHGHDGKQGGAAVVELDVEAALTLRQRLF